MSVDPSGRRRSPFGIRHSVGRYGPWESVSLCIYAWAEVTEAISSRPCCRGNVGLLFLNFHLAVSPWTKPTACPNRRIPNLPSTHSRFLSSLVYLVHPIVIFVWQLGDREKQVFRLITFGMDYLSVCVVSYVAALIAALLVEFPCASLWKDFAASSKRNQSSTFPRERERAPFPSVELEHASYGAVGTILSS
jgi:hypothetical protein